MTPSEAQTVPVDPYAIWLRTRSAVTSSQYPEHIAYKIGVSGLDGSATASDHYRASYDSSNGSIRVFSISDEQLEKPAPVPHGFNVMLTADVCFIYCIGFRQPVGRPEATQDLFGPPILDPTYMFRMRYKIAASSTELQEGDSALRTIAVVSNSVHDYQVSLMDTPTLDGVSTYHLKLVPLRSPKDNRLRELWVGSMDYLPRRAVIAGNFTIAPLVDVPWSVDFEIINGAPYISREAAAATLYMAHRRVIKDAVVAFEDIREPDGHIYGTPLIQPNVTDDSLVEPRP